MKPVSPVLPMRRDLKQYETVIAKDQPEYNPLPSMIALDGTVTTRWYLSFTERIKVLLFGDVYLQIMTFNKPLQPIKLSVDQPNPADCV